MWWPRTATMAMGCRRAPAVSSSLLSGASPAAAAAGGVGGPLATAAAATAVLVIPRRGCFYNEHIRPPVEDKRNVFQRASTGFKQLLTDCQTFGAELREKLRYDPPHYFLDEIVPEFRFNSQKDIDRFQVVTDSDHAHGFSTAEFVATPRGTAVFRGVLDTRLPKDGLTKNTGFATIQTYPKTISFQRRVYYDWSHWTHLVVRCRGDGRAYAITMSVFGDIDLTYFVQYHYPLFTRGGPYWQLTHIPMSKFYVTNKGRVQDKQSPLPQMFIRQIGIVLADQNSGPFELELDFIGGTIGTLQPEEFAYETYETPKGYTN